jgi:superfamily II DNA helicase RecQ
MSIEETAMTTPLTRTVLQAVERHPLLMSPILLEYLLRGESIGRMSEKGLDASPFLGRLAEAAPGAIAAGIADALDAGWLARSGGFYPALKLTAQGEAQLLVRPGGAGLCQEAAPERSYRVYHRWRQGVARRHRTPPYRIVPNTILTQLAARRPQSLGELLLIPGLGKRRALRYQTELLAVGRELAEKADES